MFKQFAGVKRLSAALGMIGVAAILAGVSPTPTHAATVVNQATGKITMLRVQDVGLGYGPAWDYIDVEAVIQLDSKPGKAFGFQLRSDGSQVARQSMLDFLKEAYLNDWSVTIYYLSDDAAPFKNNHRLIRAWVNK
jgi:hypothetical protein